MNGIFWQFSPWCLPRFLGSAACLWHHPQQYLRSSSENLGGGLEWTFKPHPPRHPTGVQSLQSPRMPNLLTSMPQPEQFKTCFCGGVYILKSLIRGLAMSARHPSKSLSFTAPQLAPWIRSCSPTTKLASVDLNLGLGSQEGEMGGAFQIVRFMLFSLLQSCFVVVCYCFGCFWFNFITNLAVQLQVVGVAPTCLCLQRGSGWAAASPWACRCPCGQCGCAEAAGRCPCERGVCEAACQSPCEFEP